MNNKILSSGVILSGGLPFWGFWEEIKIGRFKAYIEYFYSSVEAPNMREVLVDVYHGRRGRRPVRTLRAGEVQSWPVKIRARVGRRALQRLDVKDALLRHVLERVQEHNR